MKKIVYLSLDERPCNYDFPSKLFSKDDFEIITIDKKHMGFKKTPANTEKIIEWILEESKDAYGLVISIDTLIYGGIVPSRLHYSKKNDLKEKLSVIKKIKENNPKIIIYGFQLIMRSPGYNSSEEEPEYYETHGKLIHRYGYLNHLIKLNLASEKQKAEFNNIQIPKEYLEDFSNRREINRTINVETLSLVKDEIIDFLVIPQDDSAEYGWTAIDQEVIHNEIINENLITKVYMYPGADEVGMTLMARMYNKHKNVKPKLYIKYPSISSGFIIPNIEDRYLDTMVKYHIIVSGGLVATSLNDADGVLFINAPADRMLSRFSNEKEGRGLIQLRNMPEAIEFLEYSFKELKLPIIIGDITYGNGSSLEIYNYLKAKNMLFDIAAFGGWNTASNAIGGAVAQGMAFINDGKTQQLMDFLMLRYVEDIAYCGYVRQDIMRNVLPNYPEYTYNDVKDSDGPFSLIVKQELETFIDKHMKEIKEQTKLNKITHPWKRMYEVDIDIKYKGKLVDK